MSSSTTQPVDPFNWYEYIGIMISVVLCVGVLLFLAYLIFFTRESGNISNTISEPQDRMINMNHNNSRIDFTSPFDMDRLERV